MSRININDTIVTTVLKMAEGNHEARQILEEVVTWSEIIDPDNFAGPYGGLIHLDSQSVYGGRITLLYKNICKENMVHMLALLRASLLGLIESDVIYNALNNVIQGVEVSGIDLDDILRKVKARLPRFDSSCGIACDCNGACTVCTCSGN
jgi:hypothetical protein